MKIWDRFLESFSSGKVFTHFFFYSEKPGFTPAIRNYPPLFDFLLSTPSGSSSKRQVVRKPQLERDYEATVGVE